MQPAGRAGQPLDRPGHRHGGDDPAASPADRGGYRGDARLALGHAGCPAAPPDLGQHRRAELGAAQAPVHALRVLPGEQHLGGRPGSHRQGHADGYGVAQSAGPFGGGDADPCVRLPAVQLGALAGHVAQVAEDRLGHRQQPVLPRGRGQLGDPGPQDEAALGVTGHEPVMLQRDGDPVRGRPRQARRADELGERSGAGLHGAQHGNGLVQYADSARVVHVLILPSRYSRRNRMGPRGAGWFLIRN